MESECQLSVRHKHTFIISKTLVFGRNANCGAGVASVVERALAQHVQLLALGEKRSGVIIPPKCLAPKENLLINKNTESNKIIYF